MIKSMRIWSVQHENVAVTLLRWSLALIFIWFGLLKVAGYNPVFDLVYSVFPFMAAGTGLKLLGIFETLIGLGLFLNRWRLGIHIILLLHLAGTFLTFFTAPSVVFTPNFPILSLAGEFVIKNMALAIAGIVVLIHEAHRERGRR